MPPAVIDIAPGLSSLRRCCDHCLRHDLDKRVYKRCGGCSAVMYCSKECQKAAWPGHREACRWGPPSVGELGYATPLALKKQVQEWTGTHHYALTTIANAIVYLSGGWDAIHGHPFAVVMHLGVEPHSRDANPSQAFRVTKTRVAHRDSERFLQGSWETAARDCRMFEQDIRRDCAETIALGLLGVVPAAMILEGTDILVMHKWMVFRNDAPTNERTSRAFKDLVSLCAGVIRGGYVFRAPENHTQLQPDFGRLVKSKSRTRQWQWETLDIDIDAVVTTSDMAHSGLSNHQLLTLFRPLRSPV